MEREFSVLYFYGAAAFSVLTQTKFDRNDVDSKNMNDYIFNCDLLIIDDLKRVHKCVHCRTVFYMYQRTSHSQEINDHLNKSFS